MQTHAIQQYSHNYSSIYFFEWTTVVVWTIFFFFSGKVHETRYRFVL